MSKISRTIAKKYRYLFYSFLTLSAVSGSCFWFLKNFAMTEGDFGPQAHFLQYPMLQIHGFSAFLMLMALGSIYSSHASKNWSGYIAKKTGITLLCFSVFSLLSAYSLYYLVSEKWHVFLANSHALAGLLLPLLLFIHLKHARIDKSQKKQLIKAKKLAEKQAKRQRAIQSQKSESKNPEHQNPESQKPV